MMPATFDGFGNALDHISSRQGPGQDALGGLRRRAGVHKALVRGFYFKFGSMLRSAVSFEVLIG